jgi:hypothetical protein
MENSFLVPLPSQLPHKWVSYDEKVRLLSICANIETGNSMCEHRSVSPDNITDLFNKYMALIKADF